MNKSLSIYTWINIYQEVSKVLFVFYFANAFFCVISVWSDYSNLSSIISNPTTAATDRKVTIILPKPDCSSHRNCTLLLLHLVSVHCSAQTLEISILLEKNDKRTFIRTAMTNPRIHIASLIGKVLPLMVAQDSLGDGSSVTWYLGVVVLFGDCILYSVSSLMTFMTGSQTYDDKSMNKILLLHCRCWNVFKNNISCPRLVTSSHDILSRAHKMVILCPWHNIPCARHTL